MFQELLEKTEKGICEYTETGHIANAVKRKQMHIDILVSVGLRLENSFVV